MHKKDIAEFLNHPFFITFLLCIIQQVVWNSIISDALNWERFTPRSPFVLGFQNLLPSPHNPQHCRLPNQFSPSATRTRIGLSSKAYPYLDKDDYLFFKLIGVSDNSNLRQMAEAFQSTLDKSTNPIEKMKLRDHWYEINQKIIHHDLQGYKKSQVSTLLDYLPWKKRKRLEHNLISEFSETFLASSALPEELINKVKRLKIQMNPFQKLNLVHLVDGGIFQLSSTFRAFSILSYMVPILLMGGFVPKLSAPSIALNLLLSAGLISSRDEPKLKTNESGKAISKPPNLKTIFLTMIILSIHSGIGLLSGTTFMNYFNIKSNGNQESIMSVFINTQYIIAALNYKTYINDQENAEQQDEEVSDI